MIRTILVLVLALFVLLSIGCSKKKEAATKEEANQAQQIDQPGQRRLLIDPVSKELVRPGAAAFSYEFEGVVYSFTSEENMEAFKADPQKYLAEVRNQGGTEEQRRP